MSGDVRSPRGRRGTAATLTAMVSVLVLAWGAAEAIYLAMHRRTFWLAAPDVARFGRQTQLHDDVVLVVAIVVFAVGLLLLIAALLPARRSLVELAEDDENIAAGLPLRSYHRTLAAAAVAVDGVSAAKVTGRRRLRVSATTSLRNTEALPERVREHVAARIEQLSPVPSPNVRVRLDRKDDD